MPALSARPRRTLSLTPLLVALACLALPLALQAQTDPAYAALRAAQPDGRQIAVTQTIVLERDAFRFELRSGTVHLLAPVEGRTVGAVFLGDGEFHLTPATEAERYHLAFLTNEPELKTLRDSFDQLVLWFTDATAEELEKVGTSGQGAPDSRVSQALRRFDEQQRKDFHTDLRLRVLRDLLDPPPTPDPQPGTFMAVFNGRDLPISLAAVDPLGAEALGLSSLLGGENTILYVGSEVRGGVWYQAHEASEIAAGHHEPHRLPVDALHYEVDTIIERNEDLAGTTRIHFRAERPVRVLPLILLGSLDVQDAAFRHKGEETWTPLPVVRDKAYYSLGSKKDQFELGLVFPEALPAGAEAEVRLRYRGDDVLLDTGQEVYAVYARTSWYPNTGVFSDPATFDLTYRVPKRKEVVSVGRKVSEEVVEGQNISRWKVDRPVRVAGFNYGSFNQTSQIDQVSGMRINVFENERALEFVGRSDVAEVASGLSPDSLGVVSVGPRQTTGRANVSEAALADGLNSARLFTTYFGPLPQQHVAITQQVQFSFGQSWPSLVFLPYASFLSGTARNAIGANFMQDFIDTVGYHEMAHQWWGHHVGWDSYRDQWLSEGFAQFSALLAIQHTEGWEEYDRLWKEAQKLITSKLQSSEPVYQAGPITQGWRLSTARSKAAYQVLAYHKGAFVLHMLRMMMWDPSSPEPDRAFIAMMRDFTSTYAGKSPTTEDFKAMVQRHMVPTMNATGDGKIDWFFDQWVYGTEIPKLTSDLEVAKAGKDGYRISGQVAFTEIPEDFRALIPLYVDFGKGRLAMVGRVPFIGPGTRPIDLTVKLPEKPKKALVNAHWEVLARD